MPKHMTFIIFVSLVYVVYITMLYLCYIINFSVQCMLYILNMIGKLLYLSYLFYYI